MDYFICQSIRLCRFLYSLGFEKESIFIEGKEHYKFNRTDNLQEALDFYFYMRDKLK